LPLIFHTLSRHIGTWTHVNIGNMTHTHTHTHTHTRCFTAGVEYHHATCQRMLTYADVCLRMLTDAGVEYHHATCQTEVPPKPKAVSEDTAPPKFHRETQTKKVSSSHSWPSKPASQCAQHIRFTAALLLLYCLHSTARRRQIRGAPRKSSFVRLMAQQAPRANAPRSPALLPLY
jgi:hypothetical protein